MMPSQTLLRRTFSLCFESGGEAGSGVAVAFDGREYLLTARHVVPFDATQVGIERSGAFETYDIVKQVRGSALQDVAVLALNSLLVPPSLNLELLRLAEPADYFLGELVYAVGFPWTFKIDGAAANLGFPIPFVRLGCIAGWGSQTTDPGNKLYVDGHVANGMSGGPVVRAREPSSLLGLIGTYVGQRTPVFERLGENEVRVEEIQSEQNAGLFSITPSWSLAPLMAQNGCGAELR